LKLGNEVVMRYIYAVARAVFYLSMSAEMAFGTICLVAFAFTLKNDWADPTLPFSILLAILIGAAGVVWEGIRIYVMALSAVLLTLGMMASWGWLANFHPWGTDTDEGSLLIIMGLFMSIPPLSRLILLRLKQSTPDLEMLP